MHKTRKQDFSIDASEIKIIKEILEVDEEQNSKQVDEVNVGLW